MFTQFDIAKAQKQGAANQEKTNIKRCNGCSVHCTLDVQKTVFCDRGEPEGNWIPVINDIPIYNYIDGAGRRTQKSLRKDLFKEDINEMTQEVAQKCDNHYLNRHKLHPSSGQTDATNGFTQQRFIASLISQLPKRACDGCLEKCALSATYKNSIFYPVVGGQIIKSYVDKQGKAQWISSSTCESLDVAQKMAEFNICTVCSYHRQNTK